MKIANYIKHPFKSVVMHLNDHGKLNGLSDEKYLKLICRARTGRRLDLNAPKTYNEKLQWIKLNDRKDIYTTMVDKYEAKNYAASIIGADHIVPTYGVWDSFEDIDFDALPDKFVIKTTHDSGVAMICRDKSTFDFDKARAKLTKSLHRDYYLNGREWPYKNVKPRIIAEQYLEDGKAKTGLVDYKFFCFNGEPKMLYVSEGLEHHPTAHISFFGLDGKQMPFKRSDFAPIGRDFEFPDNFDEMLKTAGVIAREVGCPFSRIDLYSVNGKIYFSEITFFPCGGFVPFDPPEWDRKLGDWIKLPIDKNSNK